MVYEVREGSPVEISGQSGEDLWWEGFVEQVSFKSEMEERGSDGWCDGGEKDLWDTLRIYTSIAVSTKP